MAKPTTAASIKRFHRRPQARLRLFCFPWAGVGASAFFPWSQYLSHEIEVNGVQYPGREDRLREAPMRRMSPLAELLLRDLQSYGDQPFAFWGHSMGALVAFELTRHLARAGGPTPGYLLVSGRQPPHLPEPLEPIHHLPDAELVSELQRRYGGMPDAIARDPEVRAVFLPTIRADLELIHTYVHEPGPPLDCGISALGGTEDRVSRAQLEGWSVHTQGTFRLHHLPGDHFFITVRNEAVIRHVTEDLRAAFPSVWSEEP